MRAIVVIISVPISLVLYAVANVVYNVYLHPLRRYPGPKAWAASRLPWFYNTTSGQIHTRLTALHKQYGPVVRIAPNELSYTEPAAWRQIYGHRSVEMPKDLDGAGIMPSFNGAYSIVNAPHDHHLRLRRAIAPAFSEKALREQESMLQTYVDLLVSRLKETCKRGPQDLVSWYNFATFDMMGDMAFGEPFGCLRDGQNHAWVNLIFSSVKSYPWYQVFLYYRIMSIAAFFTPKKLADAKRDADANAHTKVDRRMAMKALARKDFMSYILPEENDRQGMEVSLDEIKETAAILIIAGSETSATLLSGVTYYMLTHPLIYERAVKEVRGAFQTYADVSMIKTGALKYIPAIVQETFRMYPPAPVTFPRKVPGAGEEVLGRWVPGGTTVGVPQYAAYRSPSNFYRPDDFLPERWLSAADRVDGDLPAELFANDQAQVLQPFSFGPRNCIGKALAYVEIRLILAKMLWSFDMSLTPQQAQTPWDDQGTYMMWEKHPLMVNLKVVQRGS
ncbi:hypothetical protein Z517_09624 [Fonsecaea pedrosoi CBS 271.37]|uniref:Cytochrome P450 monooxygenase n=1 Tax=Fonsecaea pedrosoi CBS 271.37 TaxID=1442368 RepID=A0A0D2G8Z3_9EURO|nr:uncharacterized protein Z517_09624 [Fonsecaea pedrosoi CBS 271.37]KIW77178.1 hypothetical protein Z517_09624 [Fonsecaea pedrosoi CBS 271.37]